MTKPKVKSGLKSLADRIGAMKAGFGGKSTSGQGSGSSRTPYYIAGAVGLGLVAFVVLRKKRK